jgi:hypothetical protein
MPVAIVFNLGEVPTNLALSRLRACPGLTLIGVDPASEDILVLSGQQVRAVTMSDMAQLIAGAGLGRQCTSPAEQDSSQRYG